MGAVTNAVDAVAEVLTDHCTGFPEGDWQSCCERHDVAYETGSRLRLDRKVVADGRLAWCFATTQPTERCRWHVGLRRPLYHGLHVLIGIGSLPVTLIAGLWFWARATPIAGPTKRWAHERVAEASARPKTSVPPWWP